MKTICSTNTEFDFIIEYWLKEKRNNRNEIIWTDEEKSISETENKVDNVTFFYPTKKGEFIKVKLTKFQLQQLIGTIESVEAEQTQPEYID